MLNAVRSTLPESAAMAAQLRPNSATAKARAKFTEAPGRDAVARHGRRYNRSINHRTRRPRMGKGDVRTRRGKIFNGSYGKKRPHKPKQKKKR
jgi:ribosomal small subunit protein bTHX